MDSYNFTKIPNFKVQLSTWKTFSWISNQIHLVTNSVSRWINSNNDDLNQKNHFYLSGYRSCEGTRGLAEECRTHDHHDHHDHLTNVVCSSPTTGSMFVSFGKILNLNLFCWQERIWESVGLGNLTIVLFMGCAFGRLQIIQGELKWL